MFNEMKSVNIKQIRKVLTQMFFFVDASREFYDLHKLELFTILYCSGDHVKRTQLLFQLMSSSKSGCIVNRSKTLLETIENMVDITCIVMTCGIEKDIKENPFF